MNGRRQEFFHNSPEQVRDAIREAIAIVDELGVPHDLRVPAFEKAATLLAAKEIQVEMIAPNIPGLAIPQGPKLR